MSCAHCTSIPQLPTDPCQIYINAKHEYMLDKVATICHQQGFSPIWQDNYLHMVIDSFSEMITTLGHQESLTDLEKKSIHILAIAPQENLSFRHMAETKTLENWFTLLNANDLVWILEQGSITVYFQPIIDLHSQTIYAYECLSRGVLADGSLMSPQVMFDTAKKTDLLFNLDRQCRETAIKTAAVKNIPTNIFINFLPSAIYNPEFCLRDTVKWAQQLEFDPDKIVFEVVETEHIRDINHLIAILKLYKSKGFRTALDDVGSGYSSLNLFATLAPDIIKIDLEIVRDIHNSEVKQAVAKALIQMGRDAGCKVLAEGIESLEEYNWFKTAGADYAQGYYFARPTVEPLRSLN